MIRMRPLWALRPAAAIMIDFIRSIASFTFMLASGEFWPIAIRRRPIDFA